MVLEQGESEVLLDRHKKGDYGNVSVADACVNDLTREENPNGMVISKYRSIKGFEIVVITENGVTRISLPQEVGPT